MALRLPRNETLLMAPGSLAGPTGAGVRHLEQPSGIAASYTATGTDTDTCANAAAAAGWVGYLVEFTSGTSDNIKHIGWITNVDPGVSFEFWPAAPEDVASGDTFSIYTSPVPFMVDTGGTDSASIVDTSMAGWADDEPNGYYALCIHAEGSIAVGEMKQITDFDNATGDATTAAFSASVAAGDMFLIVKPIGAEDLDFQTPQNMIERNPTRDNPAPSTKFPAERRPSVSFKVPLKGIGDAVGNGETWDSKAKGESQLLCKEIMGTFTQDQGEVTTGAGSTSTRTITTGTHEQFTAGNAALHNGELSVISSKTDGDGGDDTLNFVVASGGGPLFSAAAVTGDTVNACAMAQQATDASQYPITFLYFEDGILKIAWSCAADLNVEASPNGRLMLAVSVSEAEYWSIQATGIPATLDDSHYPEIDVSDIRVANGRVLFASTAMECQDLQISLGTNISPREDPNVVEGNRGGLMTPGNPTASVSGYPLETITEYQRVDQVALTGQAFFQFGKVAGNVVGIVFPKAQMSAVSTQKGPITRLDLTIDSVRPDESDPLGTPFRIFWG